MEYHAITKKNEIGQYVLTEEVRTYIRWGEKKPRYTIKLLYDSTFSYSTCPKIALYTSIGACMYVNTYTCANVGI